jgi:DNA polymerase-3 subunit beta
MQQCQHRSGQHHIRADNGSESTFTSKLVDGKLPDYERVLPRGGDKLLLLIVRSARPEGRTAILSNEISWYPPAA